MKKNPVGHRQLQGEFSIFRCFFEFWRTKWRPRRLKKLTKKPLIVVYIHDFFQNFPFIPRITRKKIRKNTFWGPLGPRGSPQRKYQHVLILMPPCTLSNGYFKNRLKVAFWIAYWGIPFVSVFPWVQPSLFSILSTKILNRKQEEYPCLYNENDDLITLQTQQK